MANPARLVGAFRASRGAAAPDRRALDPQLRLYSRILGDGHLHYGYFADPERAGDEISLADFRDAQRAYAGLLLEELPDLDRPVLDCGCGMGGLLELLSEHGYQAVGITPDRAQVEYLDRTSHGAEVRRTTFEELDTERFAGTFGAVVCAESMQYLALDRAFEVAGSVLAPGGRWIVCDYFRRHRETHEGSGHLLEDFRAAADRHGWSVRKERDITEHVIPTLRFAYTLAETIGRPVLDFLVEKLRTKRPGLHHLCRRELESLDAAIDRKMTIIDPEQMRRDKTYRLFVLEKR